MTVTPLRCQRLDIAGGHGLCLMAEAATLRTAFKVQIFDPDFKVQHTLSLGGLLSRARVSPDGRYGVCHRFPLGPLVRHQRPVLDQHDAARSDDRPQVVRPREALDHEEREAVPGGRLQLLGRDLRERREALLRDARERSQDLSDRSRPADAPRPRPPRERGVPGAVPGQHADRVQETGRQRRPVALHRAGPRDDARDAARRDPVGRRSGGMARRRPRPLRLQERRLEHSRRRQRPPPDYLAGALSPTVVRPTQPAST